MINKTEHTVAWALWVMELDEAKEHLEGLIKKLTQDVMDEAEFAVEMGHIYAHLNRVWHSRSQDSETTDEQWPVFSQFPKDLKPVG